MGAPALPSASTGLLARGGDFVTIPSKRQPWASPWAFKIFQALSPGCLFPHGNGLGGRARSRVSLAPSEVENAGSLGGNKPEADVGLRHLFFSAAG